MDNKNIARYIDELINIIENPEKVSEDYKTTIIYLCKKHSKKLKSTI